MNIVHTNLFITQAFGLYQSHHVFSSCCHIFACRGVCVSVNFSSDSTVCVIVYNRIAYFQEKSYKKTAKEKNTNWISGFGIVGFVIVLFCYLEHVTAKNGVRMYDCIMQIVILFEILE